MKHILKFSGSLLLLAIWIVIVYHFPIEALLVIGALGMSILIVALWNNTK